MNWIINGSRKFIMLYNSTPGGPHRFKIDTDEDLDFAEEREFNMYQDYRIHLEVSGQVIPVTIRGVNWVGHPNIPWTLMIMDDISHQVDTSLFDFINSRDWIRVGIHYPWMATKPSGNHWGRSIDESAMWNAEDQYDLCREYFEKSLEILEEVIDAEQVEPVFTPSEHTIGEDYLKGFSDAGMVVHLANWQALFGPEKYVAENNSQWFYNMFRGQEGGWGPSNWMQIANMSGIAARNLGIDIDSGGNNFFPDATRDMEWMNENGWLTDYSDMSVQVASIMDAWRFWSATREMLWSNCRMVQTPDSILIEFTGDGSMEGITWMLPTHDYMGRVYHKLVLDGAVVLANLTRPDYFYYTMQDPSGNHVLEIHYGQQFHHSDPRSDYPLNLSYTWGSTGNTIGWKINDWQESQGSYAIFGEGRQLDYGTWFDGVEVGLDVDNLEVGEHAFDIVFWDSRSPKLVETIYVEVLPIGELVPVIIGVSTLLGLFLKQREPS
jgi:hypothetical protein